MSKHFCFGFCWTQTFQKPEICQALAQYDGRLVEVLDQVVAAETIGLVAFSWWWRCYLVLEFEVALLFGFGFGGDLVEVKEGSAKRI